MPKHTTLTGHTIEYDDPSPALAKFLRKVERRAKEGASESDLIELVYSSENPLLAPAVFKDRGAVTKATLDEPAYYVLLDLIDRARVTRTGLDADVAVAELAKEYTVSVAEAAAQVGVHESAIRQAIAARRLSSWLKDGRHYLHPRAVDSFAATLRRPVAEDAPAPARVPAEPLEVFMGSRSGTSFRVKFGGKWVPYATRGAPGHGWVHHWHRIGVAAGTGDKMRFVVIEPSSDSANYSFEEYFVTGKFKIVAKENNARRAAEAWKAFKPA